MTYFTTYLSATAHALRLPEESREDSERFVRQHQKGAVTAERAPFGRQLDLWAFSLATAVSQGLEPLDEPSSKWGRRFITTKDVQMPDELCDLLAVVAMDYLGVDHPKVDDPAEIVEIANRFAGAGCPEVISKLKNPDLRVTTLDKILEFANGLYSPG